MKAAYVPNQHGAWAMLILPFLFGISASEAKWLQLPLFACWLLVYLFSFPVLQWVKTGKSERYRRPAIAYGILLTPVAIGILAVEPKLFWFTLPILPLFLINLYYAKKKDERALINDVAAILLFSYIVFPVWFVGGGGDYSTAVELFALSALYFVGTAFYVKTIIRERNNPAYYLASILYHAGLTLVGTLLDPWLVLPMSVLLARAAVLPKIGVTAKQAGITEIGFSAMLYLSVLWFYF